MTDLTREERKLVKDALDVAEQSWDRAASVSMAESLKSGYRSKSAAARRLVHRFIREEIEERKG